MHGIAEYQYPSIIFYFLYVPALLGYCNKTEEKYRPTEVLVILIMEMDSRYPSSWHNVRCSFLTECKYRQNSTLLHVYISLLCPDGG